MRLRNNRPHPNNSGHRKYSRVPASLKSQASRFWTGSSPHNTASLGHRRKNIFAHREQPIRSKIENSQACRCDNSLTPGAYRSKKRPVKQFPAAFRLPCQDHRSISKFANECTPGSIPMPAQRFPISYQTTLRFLTPPHSFERKTCTICTTKLR